MRHRIFFRTLLGAQFLIFLFLFGSGLYLLWLSRSPQILSEPDAVQAAHGLKFSAAICLGACVPWFVSFFGLLRRQVWAWWLGIAINFFVLAATAYDVLDGGAPALEDLLAPAVFLLIIIVQLLTRPTTWKQMELATQPVNEIQQSAGSGI